MKPIGRYMEEMGVSVEDLIARSGLDEESVRAIVAGNYIASPLQRRRLSSALGLTTEDISWGHAVPVEHLRGNGPQSGRST